MPQSVRNEQRNGTITAQFNESKTAHHCRCVNTLHLDPPLTSLAKALHNYCTLYKHVVLTMQQARRHRKRKNYLPLSHFSPHHVI